MPARALIALAATLVFALASGCSGSGQGNRNGAAPGDTPAGGPTAPAADVQFEGVDAVDAQTAYVYGTTVGAPAASLVVKTIDGGATWTAVLRVADVALQGIDFADAQNGVVIDEDGGIYATSDGGQTWSAKLSGLTLRREGLVKGEDDEGPELTCIAFTGPQTGWIGGARFAPPPNAGEILPSIARTTDGGATWKEQSLPSSVRGVLVNQIAFAGADGWAVAGDATEENERQRGVLLRSKDGGATWQAAATGLEQVLLGVAALEGGRAVVVGEPLANDGRGPSEIFTTEDGGATWQSTAKSTGPLFAVRFADAQNGWAVGAGAKIFRTTDGGRTWSEQSAGSLSGGTSVAPPPPASPDDKVSEGLFYDVVLFGPGRGWTASDIGPFEYRAK